MFKVIYGIESFSDADLDLMLPYLTHQRRDKVLDYRFLADRISSACAFLALRLCLFEAGNQKASCVFNFTPEGKPYFSELPDLHFSISHDRKGVCAAISDGPIGVDIQNIITATTPLADYVFSANEKSAFYSQQNKDEWFTKLWVMKESFGKKLGIGVFEITKQTDFSNVKLDDIEYTDPPQIYTMGGINDLIYGVCSHKKETIHSLSAKEFLDKIKLLPKY